MPFCSNPDSEFSIILACQKRPNKICYQILEYGRNVKKKARMGGQHLL